MHVQVLDHCPLPCQHKQSATSETEQSGQERTYWELALTGRGLAHYAAILDLKVNTFKKTLQQKRLFIVQHHFSRGDHSAPALPAANSPHALPTSPLQDHSSIFKETLIFKNLFEKQGEVRRWGCRESVHFLSVNEPSTGSFPNC